MIKFSFWAVVFSRRFYLTPLSTKAQILLDSVTLSTNLYQIVAHTSKQTINNTIKSFLIFFDNFYIIFKDVDIF